MSDHDLTLPGDLPGLLRRGSPVFWRDEITPFVVAWVGPWPGSDNVADGAIALVAPGSEPCLGMVVNACSDLTLDLTDPTGRAHAVWWALRHPSGKVRDAARAIGLMSGCNVKRLDGLLERCATDDDAVGDYGSVPPDGNPRHDPEMLRDLCLRLAGRLR